jgi:uncharacterized damage-inducible protein DinB
MTYDDIVQSLAATPAVLAQLVRGLSEEALRAGHGEENWSVKEVVVHLRDAEEVALERFTRMAREEMPFLPAYDQAAYARDRGYQQQDAAAALAGFAELRGCTVDLFRSLTAGDLHRPGVHEETGAITLGLHVEHVISHDLVHLGQIARALA